MSKIKISILITLMLIFGMQLKLWANVLPLTTSDIPTHTIGLYQVDERITVYEKSTCLSKILLDKRLDYSSMSDVKNDDMFAVLVPNKSLGYLYVTDAEDDWVEVIYDKSKNLKGWVYKNDDFQFLPWMNFYNMYGRKYGLCRLKNSPNRACEIHSQPDETSQVLGKMTKPKQIRLIGLEGNWVLVTVLDVSSYTNTGYIEWRDVNGSFYLFPDIK